MAPACLPTFLALVADELVLAVYATNAAAVLSSTITNSCKVGFLCGTRSFGMLLYWLQIELQTTFLIILFTSLLSLISAVGTGVS
jgi:hypothetical protein